MRPEIGVPHSWDKAYEDMMAHPQARWRRRLSTTVFRRHPQPEEATVPIQRRFSSGLLDGDWDQTYSTYVELSQYEWMRLEDAE
jgi:hypothetical protein